MSDKTKSSFVPNSFQTPNGYVDDIMPYLTGEEYKVLTYAVRRILGFQKRQDRISLSQFTDGTRSIKDGHILDSGTGLSRATVINCLDNLVKFGLMVKEGENDPKTNEGTLWSLQWNEDDVNWKSLQEHLEKRSKINSDRMAKARSVRQKAVSGTDRTPDSGTDLGGVSGTDTQKTVLETHLKTDINGLENQKDTCLAILQEYGYSVFGNNMTIWYNFRRRLDGEDVTITGDRSKIVICGLKEKPKGGAFTQAEIWQENIAPYYANLGLVLEFQP